MSSVFQPMLFGLLICVVFPFALIGVSSSELASRWQERHALLASAGTAVCLAGAWFAFLIY